MATILLYGDTARYPAMRHEVPFGVLDPLLFVSRDGHAYVMTSSLEAARIARVLPDAEVVTAHELGFHDLAKQGMSADEADLETAIRALRRWGIEEAVVPPDLAVAVADRLRGEGIALEVDARVVNERRRVKTPAELAGAPAPADVIVSSVLSGEGGHDPGSGPLPADLPIIVDLWPRDEESGCWADMRAPSSPAR